MDTMAHCINKSKMNALVYSQICPIILGLSHHNPGRGAAIGTKQPTLGYTSSPPIVSWTILLFAGLGSAYSGAILAL